MTKDFVTFRAFLYSYISDYQIFSLFISSFWFKIGCYFFLKNDSTKAADGGRFVFVEFGKFLFA